MTSPVCKRCPCAEARWPKCPHPWYLKQMLCRGEHYAPNLTRHAAVFLQRTLTTKSEAERVALDVRAAILDGTYVAAKAYAPPSAPAVATGQTLDALCETFTTLCIDADVEKAKNSKVNDRANLARLRRTVIDEERGRLGTWPMGTITIQDLIAFRAAQEGLAASTWNKIRTTLGQLWTWARWQGFIESDILVEAPPAARKFLRRGKARQRRRRISDTLWRDLLTAASELQQGADGARLRDLLTALMETAARVGELLALQWGDVQRTQQQLFIRGEEVGAGKTAGSIRPVDISTTLDAILNARQTDPVGQAHKRTAYVFGDPYGGRIKSITKAWGTTVLRAHRIEPVWTTTGDFDAATRGALQAIDLHVHDIRHEAACRWLESGCFDLAQISAKLGHASVAQTATYLHAVGTSLRGAQQQYDAQRAQAAAAPKPVLSPHKVHTNDAVGHGSPPESRLVKSDKSHVVH